MNATSGHTSPKQFAFYDPDGSCWRTWPAISLWGSEPVLGDLATLGYDTRWTCVRASDVGAPHRRERVFILATDPGSGTVGPEPVTEPRSGSAMVAGPHRPFTPDTDGIGAHRAGLHGSGERWRKEPPHRDITATDPDSEGLEGRPALRSSRRERATGPNGVAVEWGAYEPAIRRWERITRPAPSPVDQRGRLDPPFVEWMMGLPDGWVTGLDLSRNAQLRCLGNGVVPQQAARAWRILHEGWPS